MHAEHAFHKAPTLIRTFLLCKDALPQLDIPAALGPGTTVNVFLFTRTDGSQNSSHIFLAFLIFLFSRTSFDSDNDLIRMPMQQPMYRRKTSRSSLANALFVSQLTRYSMMKFRHRAERKGSKRYKLRHHQIAVHLPHLRIYQSLSVNVQSDIRNTSLSAVPCR